MKPGTTHHLANTTSTVMVAAPCCGDVSDIFNQKHNTSSFHKFHQQGTTCCLVIDNLRTLNAVLYDECLLVSQYYCCIIALRFFFFWDFRAIHSLCLKSRPSSNKSRVPVDAQKKWPVYFLVPVSGNRLFTWWQSMYKELLINTQVSLEFHCTILKVF